MKLFRKLGKYPFMMSLSASAVILTATAYMGKNSVYADYSVDLLKNPRLAVVFEGLKDNNYPWEALIDNKAKNENQPIESVSTISGNASEITDHTSEDGIQVSGSNQNTGENNSGDTANPNNPSGDGTDSTGNDETGNGIKGSGGSEAGNIAQSSGSSKDSAGNTAQGTDGNVTGKDTKENGGNKAGDGIQDTDKDTTGNASKKSSQSGAKEDTGSSKDITGSDAKGTGKTKGDNETDKAGESGKSSNKFVTVKKSYFDDALFIGDSRTVGLADYSGWKNPTFYADVGLTIYDVFDKKIAEVDGKKMTIEEALQKKSFKKIYIMLGLNEMGTGNAKSFTKAYKGVVERIEELQPDAIIFVEAIMNVTKEKSDTDPIFNNTNIENRNNHLAALADNKKIFYIDVNEAITDSTGGIPAKYTFDNIHLKAAYYKIWTDFLLKHGVIVK